MKTQPKPNVELHIDELILHGFAPADRYRIGEALQCELERLFTEQGIPAALLEGGDVDKLELGSFQLSHGAQSGAIGIQVARALYGGLSNSAIRGQAQPSPAQAEHRGEHSSPKASTGGYQEGAQP